MYNITYNCKKEADIVLWGNNEKRHWRTSRKQKIRDGRGRGTV